jgi:RNA polymerase sigma-70 factor (ECF subfamily)
VKIKYIFITGESVEVDVTEEIANIILEIEKSQELKNRAETRRHESLSLFDKDIKNADLSTDIFGNVFKNLEKDRLYAAIDKLKPEEKELLYNLYFKSNSMTQAAYAKILGITENTVQLRLAKIKKKLKELL